jgi:hypothetical protein
MPRTLPRIFRVILRKLIGIRLIWAAQCRGSKQLGEFLSKGDLAHFLDHGRPALYFELFPIGLYRSIETRDRTDMRETHMRRSWISAALFQRVFLGRPQRTQIGEI